MACSLQLPTCGFEYSSRTLSSKARPFQIIRSSRQSNLQNGGENLPDGARYHLLSFLLILFGFPEISLIAIFFEIFPVMSFR